MRKARICVRVSTHISAKREEVLHENWRELIQDRKSLLSTLDKIAPLMRIGGKMRKRALQSRYTLGSSHTSKRPTLYYAIQNIVRQCSAKSSQQYIHCQKQDY